MEDLKMGKKRNRISSKAFAMGTITLDGSRVKDNVKSRVVESTKSHDAIMRKVHRQQAKISH